LSIQYYLQVKYYRDTYAEHPDDRVNIEYTVPLENNDALVSLNGLYEQVKGGHEFEEFRYAVFYFRRSKL
jgi:hypothetical protein